MTTSEKSYFDSHGGTLPVAPFRVAVSTICIPAYGAIFGFII